MNNDSLFSIDRLKEITKDNHDFIKKMLMVFISEATRGINELKQGCEQNDQKKVSSTAHRIKASILEMKITSIKEDILQLEALEHNSRSNMQIDNLVKHVTSTLENVITGLNKMIDENNF